MMLRRWFHWVRAPCLVVGGVKARGGGSRVVGGCSWLLARCGAVPGWMKTSGERETGESHFPLPFFASSVVVSTSSSPCLLALQARSSPLDVPADFTAAIISTHPHLLPALSSDDDHLHFEDDLPLFSPDLAQASNSHTDCQLAKSHWAMASAALED